MEIARFTFKELFMGMEEVIEHKITLDEIKRFIDLVSDFHPLHVDKDYAIKNGFKNVIAQGFFVSSLSSSLVSMRLPGENTLILSHAFSFHKPIYPEELLTIKGVITKLDDRFLFATINIDIFANEEKKASGSIDVKVRN
jgi:acyl dehydratase